MQANATLNYTIPSGTLVPGGGYVVVGRNATKAQFEAFWGVTVGTNVTYLSSGDTLTRTTCGASGLAGMWTKLAATSATPGSNGKTGCNLGILISENSDAIGTGNYVYEFIGEGGGERVAR